MFNKIFRNNVLLGKYMNLCWKFSCIYSCFNWEEITDEFFQSGMNGNTEVARNIFEQYPEIIEHRIFKKTFIEACKSGHISTAKYLYQKAIEYNKKINFHEGNEHLFRFCCHEGHISVVKQLYEWSEVEGKRINIETNNNDAFLSACSYSHFEIVHQLLEWCPNLDIHMKNEKPFRLACFNNDIHLAKLLYKHGEEYESLIDISSGDYEAYIVPKILEYTSITEFLEECDPEIEQKSMEILLGLDSIANISMELSMQKAPETRDFDLPGKIVDQLSHNQLINMTSRECPICMDNLIEIETKCKHNYCYRCLINWCKDNNTCPACRKELFVPNSIN